MGAGLKNNEIKILVVDDELKITEIVKSYLERSGFIVYTAYTGKEAFEHFKRGDISLIILDLMLPDARGEDICRIIREVSDVPIIMLTAKIEEEDILKGLNLGADDYITKPFSPRQLVARVTAVLRRSINNGKSVASIYSDKNYNITLDPEKHEVVKAGKVINLTPSEYNILLSLMKYPNKVYTREELINLALGEDFLGTDRVIDSHIKNLRQKIEDNPREPALVITVHGVGYKFGGD